MSTTKAELCGICIAAGRVYCPPEHRTATTKAEAPKRIRVDGHYYVRDDPAVNTIADIAPAGELVSREAAVSIIRNWGSEDDEPTDPDILLDCLAAAVKALPAIATSIAPELVSREMVIQIAENRAALRCANHEQTGKGVCGWDIADAVRKLPALPPVARVPLARKIAQEIFVKCWPSDEPDTDTTIINAIATIIESHCGVARVPVEKEEVK